MNFSTIMKSMFLPKKNYYDSSSVTHNSTICNFYLKDQNILDRGWIDQDRQIHSETPDNDLFMVFIPDSPSNPLNCTTTRLPRGSLEAPEFLFPTVQKWSVPTHHPICSLSRLRFVGEWQTTTKLSIHTVHKGHGTWCGRVVVVFYPFLAQCVESKDCRR